MNMSRSQITKSLTEAVTYYLVKKGYSCHKEFGVAPGGRQRLDVIAFNLKMNFIGVEIKSCPADYRSDTKWIDYLDTGTFHKFYFCITKKMYENEKFYKQLKHDLKPHNVGIMVLWDNGYIKVTKNARQREADNKALKRMLVKMAWRGGDSLHNIKRRKRVYIQ